MITAVVITKNESDFIQGCLKSLDWVDELIIVDNGSSDNTVEIARKYTKNVFTHKASDFSDLRNYAMTKASSEWVLFVDADERVLQPLRKEVLSLVEQKNYSAYALSRKNIIFGKLEKYKPFWPDWVVRLIKKSDFTGYIGKVHEYPRFNGELGYSKHSLLHLTHRGLDQIIYKSLEYSKIDAQVRLDAKHPKMSAWRFVRILVTESLNQGLLRGGFFNGAVGTMDSLLQTFSLLMSYIRLWELQQPKPLSSIYKEIDENLEKNDFNLDT